MCYHCNSVLQCVVVDFVPILMFKVPTRHTIYTPGGVMHTNNYLKGTWRTMLADGPIDEGKVEKDGKPLKFIIE